MTGPDLDLDLDALEALTKAATPGPIEQWAKWRAQARIAALEMSPELAMARQRARAALASLAEEAKRFQHVKRGGFYTVVGEARLQTDKALPDMETMVVYRSEKDGSLWVRSAAEFNDGRFIELPAEEAKG